MKGRAIRSSTPPSGSHKPLPKKGLTAKSKAKAAPPDPDAPAKQQQIKLYEEALHYFQQQKYARAKQSFERVVEGVPVGAAR